MQRLYNNILLPDDFASAPCDFTDTPYLRTPPKVIDVTVGRQLFVDDFLIERTDLTPEYHSARKYEGNPVLRPEMPWEIEQSPVACPKSGGVFYDEEERLFKMWYEGGWLRNLCYATSKDGLLWERPALDVCEGTNKILTYEGYADETYRKDIAYLRPDSTSVILDPDAKGTGKYKLFLRNPGGRSYGIVAVSDDGIHFRDFKKTSDVHDRTTVFYNPFRKKWVYSIRSVDTLADGTVDRVRHYRECDDLLAGATWGPEEEHDWMRTDALDRPHPYIGVRPQLYNVDAVGYESIMIGMFQIMYGPENDVCEARGVPKITELIPMYSRDGYHFTRPSRESIVQASLCKGAWDRGYVQSVGGGIVVHGDELWIYYVGFAGDEAYGSPRSWITNGIYRGGATGIAKLRRDGFVSMNGDGQLLTRPLRFFGKSELFVNAIGTVRATVTDADGHLLGQSHVFQGDSTKAPLSFDTLDIAALCGRTVRIRFDVRGKLFSFGFADARGDFGGAHAAGVVC